MGVIQRWRNGGQAGKLTAYCRKKRWEAKPHTGEGDRDA